MVTKQATNLKLFAENVGFHSDTKERSITNVYQIVRNLESFGAHYKPNSVLTNMSHPFMVTAIRTA